MLFPVLGMAAALMAEPPAKDMKQEKIVALPAPLPIEKASMQ